MRLRARESNSLLTAVTTNGLVPDPSAANNTASLQTNLVSP